MAKVFTPDLCRDLIRLTLAGDSFRVVPGCQPEILRSLKTLKHYGMSKAVIRENHDLTLLCTQLAQIVDFTVSFKLILDLTTTAIVCFNHELARVPTLMTSDLLKSLQCAPFPAGHRKFWPQHGSVPISDGTLGDHGSSPFHVQRPADPEQRGACHTAEQSCHRHQPGPPGHPRKTPDKGIR